MRIVGKYNEIIIFEFGKMVGICICGGLTIACRGWHCKGFKSPGPNTKFRSQNT